VDGCIGPAVLLVWMPYFFLAYCVADCLEEGNIFGKRAGAFPVDGPIKVSSCITGSSTTGRLRSLLQ